MSLQERLTRLKAERDDLDAAFSQVCARGDQGHPLYHSLFRQWEAKGRVIARTEELLEREGWSGGW